MKEEGKTHQHPIDMFLCRLNQPAANYVQSRVLDGGANQDSERGHVCGVVWSRLGRDVFFLLEATASDRGWGLFMSNKTIDHISS